jgi:hypothetical protein
MRSDLRGRSRVLLWYPGAVAARTLGSVRFGSASHSRDSESEFCADLTFPELGPVYVQTFDANLKALTPIPVQVSTTPIQNVDLSVNDDGSFEVFWTSVLALLPSALQLH